MRIAILTFGILPVPAIKGGAEENLTDFGPLILQIDNHKERGDPAGDAELNEMILDEAFGGGTTKAEDNHILEIAQKTGKHPTTGKINIARAHSFDNFWRHGVHDITNQCD